MTCVTLLGIGYIQENNMSQAINTLQQNYCLNLYLSVSSSKYELQLII